VAWYVCKKCGIYFPSPPPPQWLRRRLERANGGKWMPACPNCCSNQHVTRADWSRKPIFSQTSAHLEQRGNPHSLPEREVSPQPPKSMKGEQTQGEKSVHCFSVPSLWIDEAKQLVAKAKQLYTAVYQRFSTFTRSLPFKAILEGRIKELSSVIEKMQRKKRPASTFSDLIGIRITVQAGHFRFLTSKLSQFLRREGLEVKKVEIKLPNSHRDYSAVHWDLKFQGFPIELQLMTPSQRKWAITAHDTLYKRLQDADPAEIDIMLAEIHREREQELQAVLFF